jgi:hypothetical protein
MVDIYVMYPEPGSERWLIGVKEVFHRLSHVRRDLLKFGMVDPMFGGISGQRKALLDFVPVNSFIQS